MPQSAAVAALDDILATQYNNLRDDVLSTTLGHLHDGTAGRLHTSFTTRGTATPQLTVGYDVSNRLDISASISGAVTYGAFGTSAGHTFSQAVTITTGGFTVSAGAVSLPTNTWHVSSEARQRFHFAASGITYIKGDGVIIRDNADNNRISMDATTGAVTIAAGGMFLNSTSTNNLFNTASTGAGTTTMYIGNASINTTSDTRLKTDIVDTVIDAIALLRRLRVVDFTWDDPSDIATVNRNNRGRWTGLLAQETVGVLPWVVNAPDRTCQACIAGLPCTRHEGYWRIEYEHMVPALVRAIQQLDARLVGLGAV